MRVPKTFRVAVALLFSVMAWGRAAPPALAQAPANDDFDSAVVITTVPFSDAINTGEATAAADDPIDCTNNGSVWYAYTPSADTVITAHTFGSNYDTVLSAYTGTRGALTQVPGACNDDFGGLQSQVTFAATGGTTYYFLVGFCCGNGETGGGNLTFSLREISAPANDNFADATIIPGFPFADSGVIAGASLEPGEPTPSCLVPGDLQNSVWYALTPTTSELLSVNAFGSTFTLIAAYSGSDLGALTEIDCRPVENVLTFQANAGTTYYFQIGSLGGLGDEFEFYIDVAEPLVANFFYEPGQPSRYDEIEFFSDAFDPGGVEIVSYDWDFGDGTTATGCCPTHRYTDDGEYVVTLTVATADGRQASAIQTVRVETHDVVITKFSTPKSGRIGRTRKISVGISNQLQAETVTVELYSSRPSGYQLVGMLTQYVPRRNTTGTTNFLFSYTFTPDDADIGKVTFLAVASVQGARDALPADNEAISFPSIVSSDIASEDIAKGIEDLGIQEGFYLRNQLNDNGEPGDTSQQPTQQPTQQPIQQPTQQPTHWIFLPMIRDAD